jgi:hypothetical protein
MVIKRVAPLSVAKVAGSLYAFLGLCIGALVSLLSLAGSAFSGEGSGFGALLGVGAIVAFPILYGGFGFIFTLIAAALYNVIAGMVGGIEIETQ